MIKRLSPPILILLLCCAASATTLVSYEGRVAYSAEQLNRMKSDEAYSEEGIKAIRTLLPESEQVNIEGRTFMVDNSWLHELLDSYEATSDAGRRSLYLEEAEGRLRALDAHLLRSQDDSGESLKPRDKIREILSRSEFQSKQESRLGAFFKKVWQAITDFFGELFSALRRLLGGLFGSGSGGSWVIRILLIAALAVALIFLVRSLAKRGPVRKRSKKRTVLGEEIEADATPHNLAESAIAAASRGEYRRAIRGLYIALLFEMAERRLIELEESATNREYLALVSRFNALLPPMRYLTDRFDYFWYGMFPSTESDFSSYLARYKEAVTEVRQLASQPA